MTETLSLPTRPALRYHGAKWRLAPWIIRHFPPHRVYVEPFGGAAGVLLRKPRCYAEVYNDLSGEVVNLFRVLRDRRSAEELARLLRLTPYAREEFYAAAGGDPDPVEWARRTVVRSFMGFGSHGCSGERPTGFRANSNRTNTIPAHDWVNWPACVPAFTERLQGVVIENRPATEVMLQQDGSDVLHYCDPPYPAVTRGERQHYIHEMTDDDHRVLAAVLHGLRGMVVLSGYPSALYDAELFPHWRRVERPALADGARERTEVLWLNLACAEVLRQSQPALDFDAPPAARREGAQR